MQKAGNLVPVLKKYKGEEQRWVNRKPPSFDFPLALSIRPDIQGGLGPEAASQSQACLPPRSGLVALDGAQGTVAQVVTKGSASGGCFRASPSFHFSCHHIPVESARGEG